MFDESRPFQVMLHDGTYDSLDFQPARDVVGIGGVADFGKIKTQYRDELIKSGWLEADANAKADRVKGGISIMTEQYMAIGMHKGTILNDVAQLKQIWVLVTRNGHQHGQRVGQVVDRPKRCEKSSAFSATPVVSRPSYVPRTLEIAALADRIDAQKRLK